MAVDKQLIQMQSEYLNSEVSVGVIIPAKVEKFMLLLHGYGGSFKHLDDNLPLKQYADENHMVVVTPNMNNGYYLNKENYLVNEYVLRELIPLIFKRFDLKKELPMYIAGISMGGYGSLLIGSAFQDKFRKIISISGAFIAHDVAIGNPQVVGAPGDKVTWRYFTDTFAPFDTLESDRYRNPIAAIVNSKVVPELIMTCGTKDELYERNLDAIRQFSEYGVVYDWFPIEDGLHDYEAFDAGLRYAFKRLE